MMRNTHGLSNGKSANGFKKVYFDFDKSSIKASEHQSAEYDAARMKDVLAKSEKDGKDVQFVVNGNADHQPDRMLIINSFRKTRKRIERFCSCCRSST